MKIKLFGKSVLETFDHYVLELDLNSFEPIKSDLKMIRLDKEHIEEAGNAIGKTTRKWIENDYPYAEGYRFLNSEDKQIGSCWVMFEGGDEKLYKIRKCQSYIFRLEVDEEYRGHGYSKMIMSDMVNAIKGHGLDKMCLTCATKNTKALNLYKGIGMKIKDRKIFVRVFDHNLPYYSL